MVKLTGTFSKLQKINALVIGDFMLDKYTYGVIKRISPEAPVPILKVNKEDLLPGGAGNVALNLLSLGAQVFVLGRIGKDFYGKVLSNRLKQAKADVSHLLIEKEYQTTLKNRFIAESQQVIRVDFEEEKEISKILESYIIQNLEKIFLDIEVVAISDYAKGFLSNKLLSEIIEYANKKNLPVIVDPKGNDFLKYKNAYILKPNIKEAYIAANANEQANIDEVAKNILEKTNAKNLIITRSDKGISWFTQNKRLDFEAKPKEVKDVTGAGDTVLAILCMAVANNLALDKACQLANVAASIAIEHIGCVQITLADFAKRLLDYDVGNKIFDYSHLFALKKVLENKACIFLTLKSTDYVLSNFFQIIKKLSDNKKNKVIIYILDKNPKEDFIDLLTSINEVDFIILHSDNMQNLFKDMKINKIYKIIENKLCILNKKSLFKDCVV